MDEHFLIRINFFLLSKNLLEERSSTFQMVGCNAHFATCMVVQFKRRYISVRYIFPTPCINAKSSKVKNTHLAFIASAYFIKQNKTPEIWWSRIVGCLVPWIVSQTCSFKILSRKCELEQTWLNPRGNTHCHLNIHLSLHSWCFSCCRGVSLSVVLICKLSLDGLWQIKITAIKVLRCII